MRIVWPRSRLSLVLAAVTLLVSGCGGGGAVAPSTRSATATASTPGRPARTPRRAESTPRRAASPTVGPFQAAIPSGWRNATAAAASRGYASLFAAIGPSTGGIAADVIVTRTRARSLTAGAMPAFALAGLHREKPPNQRISPARRLTVAGAPAVAVDYTHLAAPRRRVFHETVDILHGGWLYIVTCTGARATAVTGPLGAMLATWRWT